MKRVLGHCLLGVGVIGVTVVAVPGCQHNDSSLFIQDVIYPTPTTGSTGCTFSADPTGTFLSQGFMDISLTSTYSPFILAADQMVSQANSSQLQTETSDINIQGATVRVTDTDGNQLDYFTTYAAATVYASTGATPGYAALRVTMVSPLAAARVSASKGSILANGGYTEVVTYTKLYGKTLGGTSVESNEFEFPVSICSGCLVDFTGNEASACVSSGGVVTKLSTPNCLLAQAGLGTAASGATVPCAIGQDSPILCAFCYGENKGCAGAYSSGVPATCNALVTGAVPSVDAGTD